MPTRHGGSFSKKASTLRRLNWRRIATWPAASTPCTWKTDLAMSKPIVVIVCMARSSESWEPQQRPHPWHRCAVEEPSTASTTDTAELFDHLVGAGEKGRCDFEPKRFCGFEIDHHLKSCRLLDRK